MKRTEWSIKTLALCDECWFANSCFISSNIRKALDEQMGKEIDHLIGRSEELTSA